VRSFLAFAGERSVIVAHNARFDLAFLDREVELLTGQRLAAPVVDTVGLARRLLTGRVPRVGLASLAYFFGTSAQPCHRALPDAQATAEILVQLIGLAQERGARTVSDLVELAAPRRRLVYEKRSLVFGAPTRPGVYVFRDERGQALYVGRARDLRARLRSYFRSERQRPAVEAALTAVDRVEWTVLGSELEAALEELRLIRELRPPANARGKRGDRAFYLRRRGDQMVVSTQVGAIGPIRSRRRAERAARALDRASDEELARLLAGGPLPRLRTRLRDLSECLRYEDAARLRDRISARAGHPRARRSRAAPRARGVPARAGAGAGVRAGRLRGGRPHRGRAYRAAGRWSGRRGAGGDRSRAGLRALARAGARGGASPARDLPAAASAGAGRAAARREPDPRCSA
jgi:DNA polymerase-3 subunit epsilon